MLAENLIPMLRLLFLESQLGNGNDSKDMIREVFDKYSKDVDENNKILQGLYGVMYEMLLHDFKTPMVKSIYEQGLLMSFPNNQQLIDSILKFDANDLKSVKEECNALFNIIERKLKLEKLTNGLSRFSMMLRKSPEDIEDMDTFGEDVKTLIDKNSISKSASTAIMGRLSLTDKDSLEAIAKDVKSEASEGSIWKTYLTGINKMSQGGLRDGQLTYIQALQHNNKSGLLLSILSTLPFLNDVKEKMKGKTGKPAIVLFSFEDSLTKILGDIYGILKMFENPNHERIVIKDLTYEEIRDYVFGYFATSGWHFIIERIDPSDFGFNDMFRAFDAIEKEGYNIRAFGMDYLSQINKKGCNKDGAQGTDLRDLIKRTKNWIYSKGILGLTAHQLNQAAKRLKQDGVPNEEFLEKVVGLGFTEGSGQIDQEIDLEILINIIKANGKTYLDVIRGKHKLNSVIENEDDLRFCVKFPDNGNKIPPDVLEGMKPACYPDFKSAIVGGSTKKVEEFDESAFF